MMTDTRFWQMVGEMGWPEIHYDEAKYRFMLTYPPEVAEEFQDVFLQKKAKLRKAGPVEAISDGWDDTLAHIIGLGKAEWERNMANPALMFQREESLDYKESFAYCIPFSDDYKLLTDEGYEPYLRSIRALLARLDETDPDDVPPREYRLYPEIRALGEQFLAQDWQIAVKRYHERYGPGYADSFPTDAFGYVIPNLVSTLERFRLREHATAMEQPTSKVLQEGTDSVEGGNKPRVTFTGENGNVFNLIGIARKALKATGKHKEAQEIFAAVTMAASYDEALRILGQYVDFE